MTPGIGMKVNSDRTVTLRSHSQDFNQGSGSMDITVHGEVTLPIEDWMHHVVPTLASIAGTRAGNYNELLRRAEAGQIADPKDLPQGPVAGPTT